MTGVSQRALDAAKAVLAKCAATDPWFPHGGEALVLSWAEQFAIANFPVEDLLAGVTAAYAAHGHGFKPLPADILNATRAIRNDRYQRTHPRERDYTRIDRKADVNDVVANLAAAKSIPDKKPAWEYGTSPLIVQCPWCRASVGAQCHIPGDYKRVLTQTRAHPARVEAAEKARANA